MRHFAEAVGDHHSRSRAAAQVRHPGLLQDVSAALRESGLEPGSLTLEITEGTLLKDSEVLETIFGELKALGVRLAIDDFGKEYSSLSYLKRLPVDVLKIDGSFVGSLGEDPTNTTIVEAVIKLAHSLGVGGHRGMGGERRAACVSPQDGLRSRTRILPGQAAAERGSRGYAGEPTGLLRPSSSLRNSTATKQEEQQTPVWAFAYKQD